MTLLSRRHWLGAGASLGLGLVSTVARAFGEQGAFHARLLSTPGHELSDDASSAAGRWAFELIERTSAPGRVSAEVIAPDSVALLQEPFVVWSGAADPGPLPGPAVRRLAEYLHLGGVMVVDDREPELGAFRRGVVREMARVLPDAAPVKLPKSHVVFKTYYLLDRPYGRVEGPAEIGAIVRGKSAQVFFLEHDLLGALARRGDGWLHEVVPGGSRQRELAIRMAVNLAMYVLCSDYKDDQVHAPFVMRRRSRP